MELTMPQISELFSTFLSSGGRFNTLVESLFDAMSRHERSLFVDSHEGEQCNGFRPRKWRSQGLCFELRIPRTRSGAFRPMILGILKNEEDERAALFHELYVRGLTCHDIGEICEKIYGKTYSKQQVSVLTNACREDVNAWLLRPLSQRYLALYIDATYVATRRDGSVSQEAYYSILGLLPGGKREVLSVVHHPEEGALCWEMELEALKDRGVESVDVIISDGLSGIENAIKKAFPGAVHQLCTVHFKRNALGLVARKDRKQLQADFNEVFPMETTNITPIEAYANLKKFTEKWSRKYPSFSRLSHPRSIAYFTYLRFPPHLQRMLSTTNWIERLNRCYKRTLNMRASMPSPESVVFLFGSVALQMTTETYSRRLYQFDDWYIK